jgi:hypothetical protein
MTISKEQWHDMKLEECIGILNDTDMDTYILNHKYIISSLESLKHKQ